MSSVSVVAQLQCKRSKLRTRLLRVATLSVQPAVSKDLCGRGGESGAILVQAPTRIKCTWRGWTEDESLSDERVRSTSTRIRPSTFPPSSSSSTSALPLSLSGALAYSLLVASGHLATPPRWQRPYTSPSNAGMVMPKKRVPPTAFQHIPPPCAKSGRGTTNPPHGSSLYLSQSPACAPAASA